MAVLLYFAHHPDRVIGRDELIENIWDGRVVSDHAVYRAITQIRKALNSDDSGEYIKTIVKKGYKLVQPVSVIEETVTAEEDVSKTAIEEVPNDDQFLVERIQRKNVILRFAMFGAIALAAYLLWHFLLIEKWDYYSTPIYSTAGPVSSSQASQQNPKFSSNGRYIVFVEKPNRIDGNQIYLKDNDTKRIYKITDDQNNWMRASVSNDGSTLVAVKVNENDCQVVLFTQESSNYSEEPLFACADNEYIDIELNGEGSKLYYNYRDAKYVVRRVFSYSIPTGKKKQLTNYLEDGAIGDRGATLSADGNRLAFLRNDDHDETEIGTVDLVSGKVQIHTVVSGWINGFSWAGNDNDLVYQNDTKHVYKYSIQHDYVKPIIAGAESFGKISHSASSTTLAAVKEVYEYGFLRVGNINEATIPSSAVNELVRSNSIDYMPTYANTSDRIVFVSQRSGNKELWIREEDGELKQLTNFKKNRIILYLAWSPGDRYIASYTFDNDKLFIVDTRSGAIKILLTETEFKNAEVPTWSTDGKSLYFSSDQSGEYNLYNIDIITLETKLVSENGIGWKQEKDDGSYVFIYEYKPGLYYSNTEKEIIEISQDIDINHYQVISLVGNTFYFLDVKNKLLKKYDLSLGTSESVKLPVVPTSVPQFSVSRNGENFVFGEILRNERKIYIFQSIDQSEQ